MDLESAKPKRAKRLNSTSKVALGATGVASLFGIGSTLASNITLNGGGNVEFGQGVAHQVACDYNGFTVTPESYYDNRGDGHFRVKDIKVSGLDLTPIGANYLNSSEGFADDPSGLAAAKVAHPGQYWNNTAAAWRPTCDGVVLDFQMYTNNSDYVQYTYNAYEVANGHTTTQTGINSPLMWVQYSDPTTGAPSLSNSIHHQYQYNHDAAVVYRWNGSSYDSNYGAADSPSSSFPVNYLENLDTSLGADQASFDVFTSGDRYRYYPQTHTSSNHLEDSNYAPSAQAISAITVETMNSFQNHSHALSTYAGAPGVGASFAYNFYSYEHN